MDGLVYWNESLCNCTVCIDPIRHFPRILLLTRNYTLKFCQDREIGEFWGEKDIDELNWLERGSGIRKGESETV